VDTSTLSVHESELAPRAANDGCWKVGNWPDTLSLGDSAVFDLSVASHQHLTDVYLLGLAKTNGGVLATFDRTVPFAAVLGATREMVEVIAP